MQTPCVHVNGICAYLFSQVVSRLELRYCCLLCLTVVRTESEAVISSQPGLHAKGGVRRL